MSLRSATGRCGLIRPPRRKLRPLSYPPPPCQKNSTKIPFEKRCRHAIPRPFQPPPLHTLVDCGVLHDWHRSAFARPVANWDLYPTPPPPPRRKINQKSPSKNKGATPSPSRFSPNPVVLHLIVMFSAIVTGRIVQFRPPGRKNEGDPIIPPPPK